MKYFSLGVKLNDVIKNKDLEKTILENIRRCGKKVGKVFKVVFWHDGLTEKQCKDFIKRNEKLLFEINTKITKNDIHVWYLIDSEDNKNISSRYTYNGDILEGIVQYLDIVNHMKKRDNK